MPAPPLAATPWVAGVAVAVGISVAVWSALAPARRASQVAPIAAMRAEAVEHDRGSTRKANARHPSGARRRHHGRRRGGDLHRRSGRRWGSSSPWSGCRSWARPSPAPPLAPSDGRSPPGAGVDRPAGLPERRSSPRRIRRHRHDAAHRRCPDRLPRGVGHLAEGDGPSPLRRRLHRRLPPRRSRHRILRADRARRWRQTLPHFPRWARSAPSTLPPPMASAPSIRPGCPSCSAPMSSPVICPDSPRGPWRSAPASPAIVAGMWVIGSRSGLQHHHGVHRRRRLRQRHVRAGGAHRYAGNASRG